MAVSFTIVKEVISIITKQIIGEVANSLDGSKVRSWTSGPKVAGSSLLTTLLFY